MDTQDAHNTSFYPTPIQELSNNSSWNITEKQYQQYYGYESALDDTLIAKESLCLGYLTHQILDPKTLSGYLEIIADDMEDIAPDFEPIFTDVYQYYGNLLASFTNTIDDLIL